MISKTSTSGKTMNCIGRRASVAAAGALAAAVASSAGADVTNIDFSLEDDGVTALSNGQLVSDGGEWGVLFNLTASGPNQGAAIFNSNSPGPNDSGGDADLLVNLGNILMLQSNDSPAMSGDLFDTPNDSASGGTVFFDFVLPVEMQSVTLVDIDNNSDVTLILTDGSNLTRSYSVPANWTTDVESSGDGYDVLSLTTLASQAGGGSGGSATAVEDAGFNATDVAQMSVQFDGSGGMDNVVFEQVPGPSALALLALGLAGTTRRRRA